jgi:hypothetical protein
MWYSNVEETVIARHILHQHWYTCPITLPLRRNPQQRSFLTARLSHFRTWSGIICELRTLLWEFLDPVVNRFTRQILPTVNSKYFFTNIFALSPFCSHTTHNITLLFCSTLLKDDRHFDCWSQPLNMRMRVCYLDCHEAGLCCYIVKHI